MVSFADYLLGGPKPKRGPASVALAGEEPDASGVWAQSLMQPRRGVLDTPTTGGGYGLLVAQARRKAEEAARARLLAEVEAADEGEWLRRARGRALSEMTPEQRAAEGERKSLDQVAGDALGLDPTMQTRGDILPLGRDAEGNMVPALPQAAVDQAKAFLLPGHAVGGGDYTLADVAEGTLNLGAAGSIVPGPAGAKRMFGGRNAQNAPLPDLVRAETMEKAGDGADDIWRATGWGRGADGKWRFEIDDSGAEITAPKYMQSAKLSSYARHEELFDKYPEYKDLPIAGANMAGEKASYFRNPYGNPNNDGGLGAMSINPEYADDATSLGLHEIQHAIQEKEGFSSGGSAYSIMSHGLSEDDAMAAYRRLAGEVEARNVQTRMDMDAATRRATPPWSTEDVPRDQQIVRGLLGDSGPQMSASLPMDEASRMARAEADKFEVARQNAARSVEDGGLGLYDGSEPVNRAIEMGFDDRNILYHQTKDDIKEFKLNADAKSHSGGGAVWLRDDPRYSLSAHQTWKDGEFVSGTNEMPVIIKPSGELPVKTWSEMKRDGKLNPHFPQVVTADENKMIRDMGFTHARVGGEVAVFDPSVIRSRFAAFDPARKDSTDILASYLGVPGIGMLDAMPQDDQSRERRGLLNN